MSWSVVGCQWSVVTSWAGMNSVLGALDLADGAPITLTDVFHAETAVYGGPDCAGVSCQCRSGPS
jgi:hypothetical protein